MEKSNCKASKVITQAKLTSLYGNNFTKANTGLDKSSLNFKSNISDDCMIVESIHSYHSYSKAHGSSTEEDERGYGNRSKRSHKEICSPKMDIAKSPSSNEDANADTSGNGFVTARAKLVVIQFSKMQIGKKPRIISLVHFLFPLLLLCIICMFTSKHKYLVRLTGII